MPATLHLGTQGWNYPAWVGPFYPPGTRPADFLSMYARAWDSVEVDSTFYAIPASKVVKNWAARVPERFQFSLKLPQEITHERRLRNATDVAERFYDVARLLGPKLGLILIQMGPDFAPVEQGALEAFLPTLPEDLRFAIEFRQRGWIRPDITALLREFKVALTLSDGRWIPRAQLLELAQHPTADHAYLRWMGPDRSITDYSHVQVDRSAELDQWVPAIVALMQRIHAVYGYVNNHFSGHSPHTVRELARRLGQPVVDPTQLGEQISLF
ncbi:MAG: DUF72 domain-containing protein [Gemmatimonadetes bacterium]|nr:DUF72 domain-containing protein [Gemmatimonadota bacterium]